MTVVTRKRALSVLTLREIELVKHLVSDKGYREAAMAMRLKEQTFREWIQRIRHKLRAKNNERVVAILVRHRIVK